MGEQEGDKSEEPTPHKLREARKKGQVVKSKEITSAAMIVVVFYTLKATAPMIWGQLTMFTRYTWEQIAYPFSVHQVSHLLLLALKTFLLVMAPLLIVSLVVALVAEIAQTGGFVFSEDALVPKLEKLNPLEGFKRIFFSMKGLVMLLINLVKIALVGYIVYKAIKNELPYLLTSMEKPLSVSLAWAGMLVIKIALRVALFYFVIALFDYLYQRYEFMKSMRMSKQEIKEEYKRLEGDPQIKQRIRQAQREMAMSRASGKVPNADVVVTNPVHVAVAIRYRQQETQSPVVIAKGQRLWAQHIRQIAENHYIPVVENPELAWKLYRLVPVNHSVPAELYRPVAEVLAFVYNLKRRRRRVAGFKD